MQCYSVKFCVKLEKTATKTSRYSRGLRRRSHGTCNGFMWYKRFENGREDVVDNRAGRPKTSRTNEILVKVGELLNTGRRLCVKLITDKLQLGQTTVYKLRTEDLQMRKNVCQTTTMRPLTRRSSPPKFWLISTWQHCHKTSTALTSLPVTFLCSSGLRKIWKKSNLIRFQWSRQLRRGHLTALHVKTSMEPNGGSDVLMPKDHISKT